MMSIGTKAVTSGMLMSLLSLRRVHAEFGQLHMAQSCRVRASLQSEKERKDKGTLARRVRKGKDSAWRSRGRPV